MIKPVITLDIDISSFKDIMEGTQLLNAQINWERMHENIYIRDQLDRNKQNHQIYNDSFVPSS